MFSQQAAVSTFAVLVLLAPFLYFPGGTSNPGLETKLSMDFTVLPLTLVL